ncbi:MAG: MASE1 domain-containing protein [Alphaproteobacteria bacterium]|nr:MASE1 domain-containing protein [Alphaproteobacteria bacterium]
MAGAIGRLTGWIAAVKGDLGRPGGPGLVQYLAVSSGFTIVYLILEWLTRVHELEASGITLWSPVKALSLALLLLRGMAYVPALFLALLLSDILVYAVPKGPGSLVVTNLAVALGYAGLASLLARGFNFSIKRADLRNVIALLFTVPAGTFIIASIFCGLLVLFGNLPASTWWEAVTRLWVGDTVGIIILLPVAMAAFSWAQRPIEARPRVILLNSTIFLIGVSVALWLIFSIEEADDYQFFYLLFLPASWAAMRGGFAGAAAGVCVVHLALLASITWNYPASTFMSYQLLVLALAFNGLLLGAVVDERQRSDGLLRRQHAEVARMTRHAAAGAMGVSLAHQISQPLSNVAMYLHVSRQLLTASPAQPEQVASSIDKATSQLRHAKEILERLRDFVSRGTLQPAPVDLGALARKVAALAEDDARAQGVSVRLDLASAPVAVVDALQLEQVLINLINNAIDAAAESGQPPGSVMVRVAKADHRARIEVEDNGPGMSDLVADRLFEPFVTTKQDGMGLGLALSRELINAHGGTINWATAGPNGGTRFVIDLPLDPEVARGP